MNPSFPNWVEVNLSAVERNTRTMVKRAGVALMAVIKADAYGHGAVPVARTALGAGAQSLAVARFGEARVLRQAGIAAPLLVFGLATSDEVDEALALDVTLTLHSPETARLYAARAAAAGKILRVHLKVDTGLGRMGVLPGDALALARQALDLGGMELEGLFSHFAMVDEEPHPLTGIQTERFKQVITAFEQAGIRPRWLHIANTTGVTHYPETRFNLVRVGCGLVGVKPLASEPFPAYLERTLIWKASLASCKLYPKGWGVSYGQEYITREDEWIGLLPLGYADGFQRARGNQVLIGGRRIPIIGRSCMDMSMVWLPGPLPMGTEVVIIGRQGQEEITPDELAERWDTTEVGVTSGINFRVPRVYTGG